MPEYIVVRCYACRMHQAIQANKKGKFPCKLCGAAQSVKAVLASSDSSRELRQVVQDLNMKLRDEDLQKQAAQRVAWAEQQQPPGERQQQLLPSAAAVLANGTNGSAPALPSAARWQRFCEAPQPQPPAGGTAAVVAPAEEQGFRTTFEDPAANRACWADTADGKRRRTMPGKGGKKGRRQLDGAASDQEEEGHRGYDGVRARRSSAYSGKGWQAKGAERPVSAVQPAGAVGLPSANMPELLTFDSCAAVDVPFAHTQAPTAASAAGASTAVGAVPAAPAKQQVGATPSRWARFLGS